MIWKVVKSAKKLTKPLLCLLKNQRKTIPVRMKRKKKNSQAMTAAAIVPKMMIWKKRERERMKVSTLKRTKNGRKHILMLIKDKTKLKAIVKKGKMMMMNQDHKDRMGLLSPMAHRAMADSSGSLYNLRMEWRMDLIF